MFVDLHICIQGEGRYSGVPHFLIRTSGCNLNCAFKDSICDTPYASWQPERGSYSLDDVRNLVQKHPNIHHAFITGGEPTKDYGLLTETVNTLKSLDIFVAIETNGTGNIPSNVDFVTISPKLSNSVPKVGTRIELSDIILEVSEKQAEQHNSRRINKPILKRITERFDYQVKFVYTDKENLRELMLLCSELNIPKERVYLMPEGIDNDTLQKRRGEVVDICLEHGFNYSDRLHIIIYGNKRDA